MGGKGIDEKMMPTLVAGRVFGKRQRGEAYSRTSRHSSNFYLENT